MQLFYIPEINGDTATLSQPESKHAIKVLRMIEGNRVWVADGKGGRYLTEIVNADPKKCRLKILESEQEFGKKNYHLHIAIAPTKNIDRFGWFLEKSTEIGIDEITPVVSFHSERKNINLEKMTKILVAAMKQSQKAYLPKLNELKKLNDFLFETANGEKLIAHCNEEGLPHIKTIMPKEKDVIILVGPEGDFSPEEVDLAKKSGYKEISLGNYRLRTETAGIVACHTFNLIND